MEERIIDDEYGRGVRLKKTKDGYVDATDEAVEQDEVETEETDEVAFEFPVLGDEEDDEDLVGLSPEEALKLRQKKEAEAKARKEEYDRVCAEGYAFLDAEDFENAEKTFEKALTLDNEATQASVGYWRAKTQNFANPDALVEEYADASIESLEYDLGMDAVDIIKEQYQDVLKKRYEELKAEEEPLAKVVEERQERRGAVLKERFKKAVLACFCVGIPFIALCVVTGIVAQKNFLVIDNTYVVPTVILGVLTFVGLIAFIVTLNKWINVRRLKKSNERIDATEDGERLVEVRDYMEIYRNLLIETEEK